VPLPGRLSGAAVRSDAVFYLHGFASSAKSTKAGYFAERLREHGISLRCPDFNEPDFATLTLSRMIDQLDAELTRAAGQHIRLIGSSLGGTLAILAAARFPGRIDQVVLLAPAVMFAKPGHHLLPPERIDEWRRRGALPFFHHAYNAERPLNFSFYEDSLRYDAFTAMFAQPTLVFQGICDASIDYRWVEQFARLRPNVTLSLVEDDHQLIASLPSIWDSVADFLGLVE
jgi:pimeloyl-ACP methyl ester carboxylesterase